MQSHKEYTRRRVDRHGRIIERNRCNYRETAKIFITLTYRTSSFQSSLFAKHIPADAWKECIILSFVPNQFNQLINTHDLIINGNRKFACDILRVLILFFNAKPWKRAGKKGKEKEKHAKRKVNNRKYSHDCRARVAHVIS